MNTSGLTDALQRHHRAITALGALLLLVSLWFAASAYAAPVQERHVDSTTRWAESSAFTYRVPVTRNSTHYAVGSEFPMGEPAYFRTVSDAILVNYTWTPSSDDPALAGVAAGKLVVRVLAADPDGRPYWRIEHTLAESNAPQATGGLLLSGRVDLDALVEEVNGLMRELPVVEGTVNWSVRATVVYAIDAHGAHEQGERERVLPINAGDPRYVLPGADELTWTDVHTEDRAYSITHAAGVPGVVRQWPALLVAAAAIGLLVAGLSAAKDDAEIFEREFRKFREWVSTAGRIPDRAAEAATTIDVRSLEDLIHVAADARTRVVLDERSRVFYAFLPGVTYRYARHAY